MEVSIDSMVVDGEKRRDREMALEQSSLAGIAGLRRIGAASLPSRPKIQPLDRHCSTVPGSFVAARAASRLSRRGMLLRWHGEGADCAQVQGCLSAELGKVRRD